MANSIEQSIKTGNWLFRWRSYLPVILFSLLIPTYFELRYPLGSHKLDIILEFLCMGISMFGLLIRAMTIAYTPKNTSGRNTHKQVADTLNTTGIYSITRNPLYLGNYIIILGVVSFTYIWWAVVIYSLAFFLYYERIIIAEENYLSKKFGKTFYEYCNRTPTFLPNFKLWKKPNLKFSLKNILKREYNGFFAIILIMTIMELIRTYAIRKEFIFDTIWIITFFSGLFIYLLLRSLKKYTNILNVEGR